MGISRRLVIWEHKTYVFQEASPGTQPEIVELPNGLIEAGRRMKAKHMTEYNHWKKGYEFMKENFERVKDQEQRIQMEIEFEHHLVGKKAIPRKTTSKLDVFILMNRIVQNFHEKEIDDSKLERWSNWQRYFDHYKGEIKFFKSLNIKNKTDTSITTI